MFKLLWEAEIIGNEIGAVGDLSGLNQGTTTVEQKLLGQTSTGRTAPNSLREKLAMEEVMARPLGEHVDRIVMQDPRFHAKDGWIKMQQVVEVGEKLEKIVIHYLKNTKTDAVADFKFI